MKFLNLNQQFRDICQLECLGNESNQEHINISLAKGIIFVEISLAKGTIFVEISLAKGIIFTKIGPANGESVGGTPLPEIWPRTSPRAVCSC